MLKVSCSRLIKALLPRHYRKLIAKIMHKPFGSHVEALRHSHKWHRNKIAIMPLMTFLHRCIMVLECCCNIHWQDISTPGQHWKHRSSNMAHVVWGCCRYVTDMCFNKICYFECRIQLVCAHAFMRCTATPPTQSRSNARAVAIMTKSASPTDSRRCQFTF